MSTNKWRLLRRAALMLALAPLAMATISGSARADDRDHRDGRRYDHREHRERWHNDYNRGGYYSAPPPPVYYPQPRASPGISLFFPIR